ncbi:hypothetical protein ACOMCU_00380 [Lysinibacillus sp. UGB7]|uniref:hypothetical protein n=1 Tax=Lysinibacillus sp. UGB7 TaxID=3411039 RepID=UPI003B76ADAF
MTYILYHTIMKVYVVDDESGEISEDLQKAMVLIGEEVVADVKKSFDGFVALQVERSNKDDSSEISLLQV